MVQAARNQINPLTAEGAQLKPCNCHEAVLGWLLTSLGYPRRWRLIKEAAKTHGVGHPLQFQGDWMWNHIYDPRVRLTQQHVTNARAGDIVCSGVAGRPTHSMAVVHSSSGAAGPVVNIRGFNNAGTFITLAPPPAYMQYDSIDRNIGDPSLWGMANQPQNCFGPAAGELFLVRYEMAATNVAREFPWEGSPLPVRTGPRWHYNALQGWRWF
jgi:hypothetical protein